MTTGTSSVGSLETVVSFLTQQIDGSYVSSQRIFDLEISSTSQSFYTNLMTIIENAIQGKIPVGLDPTSLGSVGTFATTSPSTWQWQTATGDQASQLLKNAFMQLNNWSQMKAVVNGQELYGGTTSSTTPIVYDPATGTFVSTATNGIDTTMNRYMAENLDQLVRTFRSAGWDPIAQSITLAPAAITAITGTSTASIYGVSSLISKALNAADTAAIYNDTSTGSSSLQQVLMVDYVSMGNTLLFNQMSGLQDAINCNQAILSYLNSLQDLMNQKDPAQFILKLSDLAKANLAAEDYTQYEKDTFNQTIGTVPKFSSTELAKYVAALQASGTLPAEGTTPGSFVDLENNTYTIDQVNNLFNGKSGVGQIEANLNYLIDKATAAAGSDATGLVSSLRTVLSDFQNLGTTGIQQWVADQATSTSTAGNYQQNLNNAVVSSQSLNDTERENLQRVMFVYEEFYKSSTSILSELNQLLSRIAQGMHG